MNSDKESAKFNHLSFKNDPGDVRDFKAFMPLLWALKLHLYDKNDFSKFNVHKSLQKLWKCWKTLDMEKIEYLMKFGIVHEVMKIEERKAIWRMNRENKKHSPQRGKSEKKISSENDSII